MTKKSPVKDEILLAGLNDIKQLSEITDIAVRMLYKWHKTRPKLYKAILLGAAKIKADSKNEY